MDGRLVRSEAKYRARLAEYGAKPAWDEWTGTQKPHRVICAKGHECHPKPAQVLYGGNGPCRACAGKDPATAADNFRARVIELGGTPLWGKWEGSKVGHKAICKNGHECWPIPNNVRECRGICITCAGRDPVAAEAEFRRLLAERGATPAYEKWLGTDKPHRVICVVGHECWPRPKHTRDGIGPCRTCAGRDSIAAEAECKRRLIELGATPAWEEWKGTAKPHRVICAAGHECWPRPGHIQQGRGPCIACIGRDRAVSEAAYVACLAERGAKPGWTEWQGTQVPQRVICKEGHECWPRPTHVQMGSGVCRICSGRDWDVFYILINDAARSLKFGITSGDPRPRMAYHGRSGYTRIAFLVSGVDARAIELRMMAMLSGAGYQPVRGFEFFSLDALPIILATAGEYGLMNELAA